MSEEMRAGELTPYQEQVQQADNLRWADKHHVLIAGLRDGSLVAVPTLGSTLMHTTIAHAHHMSEAQVAAIWRGCIATFHPDVMARAITEADTRARAILAAEPPRAAPVLAREEGVALWTPEHRAKMAKAAGEILDEWKKEEPHDE